VFDGQPDASNVDRHHLFEFFYGAVLECLACRASNPGIGEYDIAQYSDGVALQTLSVQATGSGKIVQTGYESNINGAALSIQRIEIQSKNGKTV